MDRHNIVLLSHDVMLIEMAVLGYVVQPLLPVKCLKLLPHYHCCKAAHIDQWDHIWLYHELWKIDIQTVMLNHVTVWQSM